MPSPWHDAITDIVERDPELAVTIVRDLMGEQMPSGVSAKLAPPNFNDRPSTDFECDSVVLAGGQHDPVRGIIVEAQRARSEDKRQKFAKYAAELWVMLNCPVDVVVICPDDATCRYYARPVSTSLPGYTFTPRPLHPGLVPVITDAEQMAADPSRAELVLAMHSDVPGVIEAFAEGMIKLGNVGREYYELGGCLVTAQTKRRLEELVAKPPIISTDWAKRHVAQGREEGLAEGRVTADRQAILMVLEARKLEISPAHRQRVHACNDDRQLQEWIARAATVDSADELFT